MRMIWFQDLNPMMVSGGAQQTDRSHIVAGLKRDHDIMVMTPESQDQLLIHRDDFIILSNVARFDPNRLLRLPNRYAFFHHDFFTMCRWRLYFPMSEKCQVDCPQAPIWEPVLRKAVLHIFLSPLHYEVHRKKFGDAVEPHVLVPSPVNPDEFFDYRKPNRSGTCNVHGLMPFKGRDSHLGYANEHPEENITFKGDEASPPVQLPPNCRYIGMIPEGQMTKFYNEFEWYMELPNTPQPMNRTVAEAYLCGCKIRGNSLVGALSWPWFREGRDVVKERLRQAPEEFWRALEAIL